MVPYARLGGSDGLRLSRAAFSNMIKFSEYFDDFQTMVDEVDLRAEEFQGEDNADAKMRECLKAVNNYDNIVKRWETASKMRQWINEKKKNLIEKFQKEVEVEFHKQKSI